MSFALAVCTFIATSSFDVMVPGKGATEMTLRVVACELSVKVTVCSTGVARADVDLNYLGGEAVLGNTNLVPPIPEVREIEVPLRIRLEGLLLPSIEVAQSARRFNSGARGVFHRQVDRAVFLRPQEGTTDQCQECKYGAR